MRRITREQKKEVHRKSRSKVLRKRESKISAYRYFHRWSAARRDGRSDSTSRNETNDADQATNLDRVWETKDRPRIEPRTPSLLLIICRRLSTGRAETFLRRFSLFPLSFRPSLILLSSLFRSFFPPFLFSPLFLISRFSFSRCVLDPRRAGINEQCEKICTCIVNTR